LNDLVRLPKLLQITWPKIKDINKSVNVKVRLGNNTI